jgi:hypothetical protein
LFGGAYTLIRKPPNGVLIVLCNMLASPAHNPGKYVLWQAM